MKLLIFFFIALQVSASSDLITIGERIFLDERFSQFFYKETAGDVNAKLTHGSSDLDEIDYFGQMMPSPFRGKSKSCGSCHMVDQGLDDYGMRAYNDFSELTLIPVRTDNRTHTLRNTPNLIGIGSQFAQNRTSHYDGEFFDHSETVLGNFTGRNMGWLSHEKNLALKNIVNIIKKDNGKGELAQEFGGSYRKNISELPSDNRINLDVASGKVVIDFVIEAVTAYMNDLDYEKNAQGEYNGSPYDQFLIKNGIDTIPRENESIYQYRFRVRSEVQKLKTPKFVKKKYFDIYKKEIGFGADELEGFKIFFNLSSTSRGMCMACHVPPVFSDQFFYNIGATQIEYEEVHGIGSFNKLKIPSLSNRKDKFFLDRPLKDDKLKVDLGLWNFYGRNQELTKMVDSLLCAPNRPCPQEKVLEASIGRIKTPSLRLLGLTAPYFHNGKFKTLRDTITHYRDINNTSGRKMRNLDSRMNMISIRQSDVQYLESFLESLNEHYE